MTVFERFTAGARLAVTDAQGEARRLGHRYIGTEHLLLGLLAGGDGIAAVVLRDAGVDASTVEGDVVRIVGRGTGPGSGPGTAADADALRILGIDLEAVREAAEAAFGPGALDWASVAATRSARRRFGRGLRLRPFRRQRRSCSTGRPHGERPSAFLGGHITFTPRAKKVLELSLREALALRHHYIGTEHILLGLIREGEGLAAEVLVLHGVGLDDLRRRVLAALGKAA